MKYWLWGIISWVILLCLCWVGGNQYFKQVLIKNHGPELGLALWREWKL